MRVRVAVDVQQTFSSSLSENLNITFFRPWSFDSSWRLVRNSILLSWLFWLRLPRISDMEKTDPHATINKNTVIIFSFIIHSSIHGFLLKEVRILLQWLPHSTNFSRRAVTSYESHIHAGANNAAPALTSTYHAHVAETAKTKAKAYGRKIGYSTA